MEAREIESMRRSSLTKNLSNEIIVVEIIKPAYRLLNLKFKIDKRLIRNWIKLLVLWGEEFKMTNITTGATIWSKTLKGDLEDLARQMDSSNP